jgi:hypothetical protein
MTFKVQMTDQSYKQVKIQLAMASVFLLMFMPLLFDLGKAVLFTPQPLTNQLFGVSVICFIVTLDLLVGWKAFLLAVHVKHATEVGGVIVVKRVLAPEVRIANFAGFRSYTSAVPCLSAPYYKRGKVCIVGMSIFYISELLPEAEKLFAAR